MHINSKISITGYFLKNSYKSVYSKIVNPTKRLAKDLTRYFTKENSPSNKHIKRCSALLVCKFKLKEHHMAIMAKI